MGALRDRLSAWWKRERDYTPPPGRLTEDTARRLPGGGNLQHLPGDDLDRTERPGA